MSGLTSEERVSLTETERLTLRNHLLANKDMGLTATEATAVAYIAKPAVEQLIAARLADAEARAETAEAKVARVEALADELQRLALPGMTPWDYAEDFRQALRGDS